jgi:serine/threonine-protein kinase
VPSASGIVGDVDPAVETVIRRCLDPNPARRPDSALDVARALPGGDPLAEALAAGDTPSPEMVAASDDTGTLSIRSAISCLVLIAAGLVVLLLLGPRTELLSIVPAPNSPEVLAGRAREVLEDLAFTDPPADSAYGFYTNGRLGSLMSNWLQEHLDPPAVRALLASGRSNAIGFWYRQSPRELVPANPRSIVTANDPAPALSGMAAVVLDLEGRLRGFSSIPPQVDSTPASAAAVDWQPLFDAAGLDRAEWTPVAPDYVPLIGFDERAAWTGVYPEAPAMEMRIEAAAWRGRPVLFSFNDPWFTPGRQVVIQRSLGQRAASWTATTLAVAVTLGAVLLAWRNARRGRGDFRGAVRLAAFAVVAWLVLWLLRAHHVPFPAELNKLSSALADALFYGSLFLVLYLALEPYVRRRWPQSLISWTRLLDGDWRDPVVGGHVLVGTVLGIGFAILFDVPSVLAVQAGILPPDTHMMAPALRGAGAAVAEPLRYLVSEAIPLALGGFFLYFLLRVLLRRDWLAVGVFVAIPVVASVGVALSAVQTRTQAYEAALVVGAITCLAFGSLIWILRRFGVLPFVVALLVDHTLRALPVTPDFSAWYSQATIMALLFVVGLAAASFYLALGGRQVFRDDLLDA